MANRVRAVVPGVNTTADVEAIILANDQLGALAAPINALIATASTDAKQRSTHSGEDPSTNIRMPNGQTLSQWYSVVQAFMAGSPGASTAPILTAAPTLSSGPQGVIQSGGYETAGALTSHPITFTATMVAGRFAWIGMMTAPGGSITSVTDNLSGAWTAVDSGQGSGTARLIIYYRANLPAGVTGITIVTPSTEMFAIWQERDDIQTSSPKDVSAGAVWSSTTSYTSGAVASTTGDGIAIGITQTEDGSGITLAPASPWTTFTGTGIDGNGEIHSSALGGFVAAARTTTNGTTPAFTGTASSTASGWACIVVFKKLASGGTPIVGDEITITPGAVTNGTGGDHTNEFKVIELDSVTGAETEVPGTLVELDNGVATSFIIPSTLHSDRFYAVQTPIDTVTLQRGNSKPSALSGIVGGTVPTNSVAPSISPSGSQATGQTHTVSTGTWANAATYGIQFYYGGVPFGARSTTTTITPDSSKEGLTLTYDVIAYSGLGLPSASAVAGSNSVTLTGTAAIVNTVLPAWPATIYLNTAADFTEGTWTGTIDTTRTWQFFRNSETLPYVSPPNTVSIHTPRAPAIVGDTLYIEETVTETVSGLTYTVRSAGKTITATPAALAVALTAEGTAGYTWTGGAGAGAISQATPASITGGTSPYSVSLSPTISGLSLSVVNNSVVIIGTPAATAASRTYTITVIDSAATPATVTVDFTAQINAVSTSSLTPLAFPADTANSNYSGQWSGSGSATTSGLSPNIVTYQSLADPAGSGTQVILNRIAASFSTSSGGQRAELTWRNTSQNLDVGVHHWIAFAVMRKADEVNASVTTHLMFQTHSNIQGDTTPDTYIEYKPLTSQMFVGRAYSLDNPINVSGTYYVSTDASGAAGGNTYVNDYTGTIPVAGTWTRFILHKKPGWTAAHAPIYEVWMSKNGAAYVKIIDRVSTGSTLETNWFPNTHNTTGSGYNQSYMREGIYYYLPPVPGTTLAYYLSKIYYGIGTNLYANAEATLSGLTGSV